MTKSVAVSELCEVNPRHSGAVDPGQLVAFVGMSDLDEVSAIATDTERRQFADVSKGYTPFMSGDILMAKITPCFENCKIGQALTSTSVAAGSTEFHVMRPGGHLDSRYLLHFLRQPWVLELGELRMTGSGGQRRVPARLLDELEIPLPPMEEQRRIAAILDAADALRAKRRQALDKLDTLTQAIFIDMFGDLSAFEPCTFESLLVKPLRNGISPSKSGSVVGEVLVLSAITGPTFDTEAVKESTFNRAHAVGNTVSDEDFLICRGNGNLSLVGRGKFPTGTLVDIAFPDTMIAARTDSELISRRFLNHLWAGQVVRSQLEESARTTNGTYKINQTMIESVNVPLPPIGAQRGFDTSQEMIEVSRRCHQRSLYELDTLFASLQQRAFRGEL